MTKEEFESEIYMLVEYARAEQIESVDIYEILNTQAVVAETIFRLDVEKAFKRLSY
jgi:hypothetical protein